MKKLSVAKYQKELAKIRRLIKANPNTVVHFANINHYLAGKYFGHRYPSNNDYHLGYFDWSVKKKCLQPPFHLVYFIGTPDHLFIEE